MDQRQLIQRRTAHHDIGAVAGILHPVGAETIAQAEKAFAAMLGKFEELGNPASMFAVAGVFHIEKPLQTKWLGTFTLARVELKDFPGEETLRVIAGTMRATIA